MKVLHGRWIPEKNEDYIKEGAFFLWVESDVDTGGNPEMRQHPFTLHKKELLDLMNNQLNIGNEYSSSDIKSIFFTLPSDDYEPFKSYELAKHTGQENPEKFQLKTFKVECCKIDEKSLVKTLNEIHFQLFFIN